MMANDEWRGRSLGKRLNRGRVGKKKCDLMLVSAFVDRIVLLYAVSISGTDFLATLFQTRGIEWLGIDEVLLA